MQIDNSLGRGNVRTGSFAPAWDDAAWDDGVVVTQVDRELRVEFPSITGTGVTRRRGLLYKRAFDLVVAVCVMVVAAPLFALIYVLVALTSRGPAIYACDRVGRDGYLFRCYKFRTMVVGADAALHVVLLSSPELATEFEREFKLRRDPRVTRLGKFLRRTSLDELPQFWNVVKGDMSVVGWRPLVPDEIPRYGDAFPVVAAFHPGVTGLWQVSGRNDLSYPERVALDVRYVHEAGLFFDLRIIARTVSQMARWSGNGAY